MGHQRRASAHARSRGRGFAAGVAAAHNDHIELSVKHHGNPGLRSGTYLQRRPKSKAPDKVNNGFT